MDKLFSVIIVSYKNIDILRDCLDSIKKFNDIGDSLEVIVSDNSEDEVLYHTIKQEYDWIKIIKNENRGFGAGNNRGYEISSGKFLLFLNPDTILVEPIFQFAASKFEKDSSLALFGVQLLDRDLKKNCSFYALDKYNVWATLREKLCRKLGIFRKRKMFIAGADLFVRRSAFEQAGKFDENIFMYLEEPDLQKRIRLHADAKRVAFFNNKHIIHLEGGTEERSFAQTLKQHQRILETEKYYSQKWALGHKTVKERLQYQRFKKNIYKLLRRREKVSEQEQLLELYKKYL